MRALLFLLLLVSLDGCWPLPPDVGRRPPPPPALTGRVAFLW